MIPIIDPRVRFWLSVLVNVCIGLTQGVVQLTNAIPDIWIKPALAWAGIIAFVGSTIQTALAGVAMSKENRIASAASVPEVAKVVTTNEVANSTTFAANTKVTTS